MRHFTLFFKEIFTLYYVIHATTRSSDNLHWKYPIILRLASDSHLWTALQVLLFITVCHGLGNLIYRQLTLKTKVAV